MNKVNDKTRKKKKNYIQVINSILISDMNFKMIIN